MKTVPRDRLYQVGTRVMITGNPHAPGALAVVTANGADSFEDFDYTIDVNAIETNCTGCGILCTGPDGPCLAGYNHWALRRIDGGGNGPDDVLPPPVAPGATIPFTEEIALAV